MDSLTKLLGLYLLAFTLLARDRVRAQAERTFLLGSVDYFVGVHQSQGMSQRRAHIVALWEHLGELQPLALLQQSEAKDASGPLVKRPLHSAVLATVLVLVGIAMLAALATVLLWASTSNRQQA